MYAILQLLRLPTVFTAMADIFLGYVLTHRGLEPWPQFAGLLVASCGLYLAGMVFNDIFDRAQDAAERPNRPLPSGRVSLRTAILLGVGLMTAGVASAGIVGPSSLQIALLLVVAILSYDSFLKRTPAGPLAMGTCRFLNVMLGASEFPWLASTMMWARPQIACAIGLGIYIVGVTLFARTEAKQSRRGLLAAALLVMNAGLGVLAWLLLTWPAEMRPAIPLGMIGFAAFTVNRHAIKAVLNPAPEHVQPVIKLALLSLIMLDASLILWHTGDAILAFSVAVLVVPALSLSRWIRMT